MPACGREDGGGVVVKCSFVMEETRRRSARVSPKKRGIRSKLGNADDGGFSTGASWDDLTNRQLTTWEYLDPTGKPDAEKLACPVWSGGKVERPYLSLLGTLGYSP